MKRVVIEDDKEIISAINLRDADCIIGVDYRTNSWVQVKFIGSRYVVLHLSSTTIDEAYISKTFNDIKDAVTTCNAVTFYQFPDFRSAMQYYLEQTK